MDTENKYIYFVVYFVNVIDTNLEAPVSLWVQSSRLQYVNTCVKTCSWSGLVCIGVSCSADSESPAMQKAYTGLSFKQFLILQLKMAKHSVVCGSVCIFQACVELGLADIARLY